MYVWVCVLLLSILENTIVILILFLYLNYSLYIFYTMHYIYLCYILLLYILYTIGWNEMVTKWKTQDIRVLTYMSPFFSDPSAYSNSTTAFRHNFFQDGIDNHYFIQNTNNTTYLMYSLSIKFAMLDLTNPEAINWMKEIIIQQSVEEAGSSGWMCDFGEYLPFDAVLYSVSSTSNSTSSIVLYVYCIYHINSNNIFKLFLPYHYYLLSLTLLRYLLPLLLSTLSTLQGESAASYHNRYPEEWGALTRSALEEAARRQRLKLATSTTTTTTTSTTTTASTTGMDLSASTDTATTTAATAVPPVNPEDVMFFMRSAWTQSPRYAPVFWLGDQLVSWDSNDGLRSVLTGALSSGLVGHAVTHSDIGGYTVESDLPGSEMYYVRTPELLKRWSELSAFGFGMCV